MEEKLGMAIQDDILRAILEIKASVVCGINEYFKRKDNEESIRESSERTKIESMLSLALFSFITGTLIIKKDSAEKIGLIKITDFTLTAYQLIIILILAILAWIFLYTILLRLKRESFLYGIFKRTATYPLPIFSFLVFLSFFVIVVFTPPEPLILSLELTISLLVITAILVVMGFVIGRARKPIEPKLLLNVQPSLISIATEGTELCTNIINNSSKTIKDISLTIDIPSNLEAKINEGIKQQIIERISLEPKQIYALCTNILSKEDKFKGKTDIIKIKMEAPSRSILEEKDIPAIL